MLNYIIKRTLFLIPLLIGITLITFFVINLTPGKPTEIMFEFNPRVTKEAREKLTKLYGLDKPIPVRYFIWLKKFIRLDFGDSFKDNRPVIKKIIERLPATLLLNISSLFLIFALSIPLGIYSAVKKDSLFDKLVTIFVFVGFSIPTFWLALLLMIFFGIKLGLLPITGLYSLNFEDLSPLQKIFDIVKHLILPVIVMAFTGLAALTRYIRSEMLEVLHQEYIRAAIAKGVPKKIIIFKHALKNASIPLITLIGFYLPELIGGSFIFETIFAYPGMGRLGYEAIMSRDYPVIMGVGTIAALLTLIGNFLADILYAYVDPRIRYK